MAQSDSGYEKTDVNIAKIAGYTVVTIILLAAILLFLNEYFVFEMETMKSERNQVVSSQLRDLRASEDKALHSYKIINPDKNIYQIPIDRAMKLVADEAFEKRSQQ
ncbi:MAG: hypothetical protein P8X42_11395 [Calditrichaceae bacterium]|jgi:hypothetical protein